MHVCACTRKSIFISNAIVCHNLIFQEGNVKQTSMPYFESGWVDEEDAKKEEEKKKNGGGFKFW